MKQRFLLRGKSANKWNNLISSVQSKVMLGRNAKTHVLSKYEKLVTAYHEVGHALVASVLPSHGSGAKISIISGRAAGYT